jgi:N-acetyl-gamma-glutamyl-phosphate reductase
MVYRVAVAGASGYVGAELLRLIANHPELELGNLTANTNAGQLLGSIHPHLFSFRNRELLPTTKDALAGHDIVFLALPHATSAEVAALVDDQTLLIDCGADFRLEDSAKWEAFYGGKHAGTWSYGMPELTLAAGGKQRGQLRGVKRIAVPGCNVTAISLALAPGFTAGLFEPADVVSVLSVGTSGAGRSAKTELSHAETHGSARAYGVGGIHRHTPEIEQNLSKAAGVPVSVSFTPVLVPMSRGILAVNTVRPASGFSFDKLVEVYQDAYFDESFVSVLEPGIQPATASVLGSNSTQLALSFDAHAQRVVITCAIDNLVKGTAGAAIQSMNLALGLSEQTGLEVNGVAP